MQKSSRVCTVCADRAGANNANWKGGMSRHHKGYVLVKAWGHPRAGRQGYVFEHVLVLEGVLGRHLLPEESVHHLNGVRDDNRPENLELWTRPQPSGIRAIDALAWARQILALYGDTALWSGTDAEDVTG